MHRFRSALILVGLLTMGVATVAFAGSGRGDRDRDGRHGERGKSHGNVAAVTLRDATGERVGHVWFKEHGRNGAVTVFARVDGLPPGFHGFHIHTTGTCEPPSFTSAGGHFNPTGASHGDHAGDLPTLLVNRTGPACWRPRPTASRWATCATRTARR